MKRIIFLLEFILSFAFVSSSLALTGVMNGGGGKGVVCLDSQNQIKSVELLDLWEARVLYGYKVSMSSEGINVADGVEQTLKKLADSHPINGCNDQPDCVLGFLRERAGLFLTPNNKVKRLQGVSLTLTDDSYESARPSGCEIRQIVNYKSMNEILVDQDLYVRLDTINQIALISHEAYYATLRLYGTESNSIRTRRAIGYVLGGNEFIRNFPEIPSDHVFCYQEGVPYAPTFISLYWQKNSDGSGKLFFSPQVSNATRFIGLTKRLFDFGGPDLETYEAIATGTCKRDGLLSSFRIIMNGPIEYDREISLDFTCKNGVMSAFFADNRPGQQSKSELLSLTCQRRH